MTPACGLLKSILSKYTRCSPMVLKNVYFIWMSRDKSEFSWFSALLDTITTQVPQSFMKIKVFLTEKLTIDQVYNITMRDDGYGVDPLTSSNVVCNYGRPNWNLLFKELRVDNSDREDMMKRRVGVFYCGPEAVANELKWQCRTQSDAKVTFVFKKESF